MHAGGSSLCDAPPGRPVPGPKAKGSRMGQSPVGAINVVAETFPTRHQTQRCSRRRAPTHRSGQTATHEAPRAPHGHGHRKSRGIHESTPSPSEADSSRPAHNSSARRPVAPRYAAPRSNPTAAFPRAASASTPAPSRLGSEDSPTVACAQGPRKLFREARGAPRETRAHPRFASSLARSLARRRHPPHEARQGGGPQHEEAGSHGKEHRREVARGSARVP